MPVINHWEDNGLRIEYEGGVSNSELFESVQALSSDPRFDHIHYILSDWQNAIPVQRQPEDIEKLTHWVDALARSNPNIVNAVVTPADDESGLALAAFYCMLAEGRPWRTDCFTSTDEARVWIAEQV